MIREKQRDRETEKERQREGETETERETKRERERQRQRQRQRDRRERINVKFLDEPYTKGPRHAFFPPLYKFDPPYPIAPDGFLPNSILLQKLRKSEEDRMLAATWQPPVLSDRQKKQMEEVTGLQDDELLEEEENEFMNQLRDPIIKSEETSPSPPPSPVTPPKVIQHTYPNILYFTERDQNSNESTKNDCSKA